MLPADGKRTMRWRRIAADRTNRQAAPSCTSASRPPSSTLGTSSASPADDPRRHQPGPRPRPHLGRNRPADQPHSGNRSTPVPEPSMIHLTRITRIMAELASDGVPRQACPAYGATADRARDLSRLAHSEDLQNFLCVSGDRSLAIEIAAFVDRVARSTGQDRDRANAQNKASDLQLCRAAYRNRTDDLRITRGPLPRYHGMTCTDSTVIAPEALIALEFRGRPFHDPFHGSAVDRGLPP